MNESFLYAPIIIEHAKYPRAYGPLLYARHVREHNPLCGDQIDVWARCENGNLICSFEARGCALLSASASMMCEGVSHGPIETARMVNRCFHDCVVEGKEEAALPEPFRCFLPIQNSPMRIKCVMLPWYSLMTLLDKNTFFD